MKSERQVKQALNKYPFTKTINKIGLGSGNGQIFTAVRKTLEWVLDNEGTIPYVKDIKIKKGDDEKNNRL